MTDRRYPFWIALLLYLVIVAGLVAFGMWESDWTFVYSLDDAYIHLALSKNLAQHGVWGVTEYEFSNSSSSILWSLLLAGTFLLFGVHEWVPLALNLAICIGILLGVERVLANREYSPCSRTLVLLTLVLVTPLPALTLMGMEHALHVLVTLGFFYVASVGLASEVPFARRTDLYRLLALAFLLTATRYEGIFAVFTVFYLYLLRRRIVGPLLLAASAALPLAIWGAISVANGWYWLPNSVLIKGTKASLGIAGSLFATFLDITAHRNFSKAPALYALFGVVAALGLHTFWQRRKPARPAIYFAILFACSTYAHVQFAKVGWLFRYEAYLIACGIVSLALLWKSQESLLDWRGACCSKIGDDKPVPLEPPSASLQALGDTGQNKSVGNWRAVGIVLSIIVALGPVFAIRTTMANANAALSMNDRYLEHILPARFVREYYNRELLAVNDLGAVCFFTDARFLDIYGLGNVEPVQFRRQPDGYAAADLDRWARNEGARIAIVQIDWPEVYTRVPASWIQVAEWRVPRNVVFEDYGIGFFAIAPSEVPVLRERLRAFSENMPDCVARNFMAPGGRNSRLGE